VHVHLVAVEIGIVGRRDAEVQAERGERQNPHFVAHHGHLVQRGLPVEQHQVPCLQVPLNCVANLQYPVGCVGEEVEVAPRAIVPDDELCTSLAGRRVGPVVDKLLQLIVIVRGHNLRVGQVERNAPRDAQLI